MMRAMQKKKKKKKKKEREKKKKSDSKQIDESIAKVGSHACFLWHCADGCEGDRHFVL